MFTKFTQLEFEELTARQNDFYQKAYKPLLQAHEVPEEEQDFLCDLLALLAQTKRLPITAVVSSLLRHGETAQDVVDRIDKAIDDQWVQYDGTAIIINWEPSEEMEYRFKNLVHPFPLIAKPKEVRGPKECGWYSIKQSLVLKSAPPKWMPLDHVNLVNNIPFRITDNIQETENHWDGLDQKLEGETYYAFNERRKRFVEFNKLARAFQKDMKDRPVWFVNQYDKRGRVYANGYHINPQGNDWQKACVEFYNTKVCTC